MVNRDIADMRQSYKSRTLTRGDLVDEPFKQFDLWFDEAKQIGQVEPNAMALATVADGRPSCRIVLLKGVDQGFVFYTNYQSRKGQQLAQSPHAAITFWWDKLERQVRIEGTVEQIDPQASDQYFYSRPKGSQLSAAISPQSQRVDSYQQLLDLKAKHAEQEIKRPQNWGGYRLLPERFEFWQGRENRLHDRFAYVFDFEGKRWNLSRLAP